MGPVLRLHGDSVDPVDQVRLEDHGHARAAAELALRTGPPPGHLPVTRTGYQSSNTMRLPPTVSQPGSLKNSLFQSIRALARQMLKLHEGTGELGPVSSAARANLLWSGMQHMTANIFAAMREHSGAEVLDPADLKKAEVDTLVRLMLPTKGRGPIVVADA
jgi:hypothetical protein